ncbi:Acylphosphatase [Annulohypoxylon truncatum]|uniref:Acylphosphatase n=1 Tax=Annulohypoxylon truncatum TaxID=327061 RepID=UPI0020089AC7|nr:Acylphosphatase [Annulohypoxylon truncatum]KAI1209099.1 Acylphosphatase [Annulohypoxylon truncatum]
MSQRVYFLAHGRVQGVSYRYFAHKKAAEHNITGWCRNTENGKVEGEAQGDEDSIKSFLKELDRGPTHAHVVRLDKEARDVQEGEARFEVRR